MRYISLKDVNEQLPRRVSPGTLTNWHTRGVRGVKLRVEKCGGRVLTTRPWLDDFLQALNGDQRRPHVKRKRL